jgi:hypothetical protein
LRLRLAPAAVIQFTAPFRQLRTLIDAGVFDCVLQAAFLQLSERTIGGLFRCAELQSRCRLLALSGHPNVLSRCPLSGVKRTSAAADPMSAFDP